MFNAGQERESVDLPEEIQLVESCHILFLPFVLVHSFICQIQQLIRVLPVVREGNQPEADPELHIVNFKVVKDCDHPLRQDLGVGAVGLREEDDEFVTAPLGYNVRGPNTVAYFLGNPAYNHIAYGVSQPVVDRFEIVDINVHDGELQVTAY